MKKKSLLAGIALLVVLATGSGFVWRNMANRTKFNYDDIQQHGLTIISPGDSAFDREMSALVKEDLDGLRTLIEAAKPFSVFIKNLNSQDVVACSLKWELRKNDGTTVTIPQSFSTPGVLMGMEPLDKKMIGRTSLITADSALFVTLDNVLFQAVAARGGLSGVSLATGDTNKDSLREYASGLSDKYQAELRSLTNVTVSLDGIFFVDGRFVGPDSNNLFTLIRAQVDAKRDLANAVAHDVAERKSSAQIFERLTTLSNDVVGVRSDSLEAPNFYDEIYHRSMSLFADEVLSVKRKRGEKKAIEHLKRPLEKTWPTLRKVQ